MRVFYCKIKRARERASEPLGEFYFTPTVQQPGHFVRASEMARAVPGAQLSLSKTRIIWTRREGFGAEFARPTRPSASGQHSLDKNGAAEVRVAQINSSRSAS